MTGSEIQAEIKKKYALFKETTQVNFGILNPEAQNLLKEVQELQSICPHSFCPKDLKCIYCGASQEINDKENN